MTLSEGIPHDDILVPKDPENWDERKPFPYAEGQSYVSGHTDPLGTHIRYFEQKATHEFCALGWVGPRTVGPPGHCHGGCQAAILDETMGGICWNAGYKVLAAKIEIQFRKPLPLRTLIRVSAQIDRVEGKKVYVRASLASFAGEVFSESTGLFVQIDTDLFLKNATAGSSWPGSD